MVDLNEWTNALSTSELVMRLHLGDRQQIEPIVQDAPVITDDRPYTEFPLWRDMLDPASTFDHNAENLACQINHGQTSEARARQDVIDSAGSAAQYE